MSTRAMWRAAVLVPAFACVAALGQSESYGTPEQSDTPLEKDEQMVQTVRLVDAHTAGVLPRGYFDFQTGVYPSTFGNVTGAGLSIAFAVGITHRLNLGLSYGGDGVIGRGPARGNPYPGGFLKYRLIEEGYVAPALAIGYEHQGYGGIEEREGVDGFMYKSQGFFIALSKNFLFLKHFNLGFHGTVNYSLEEVDEVVWPNAMVGTDLGFNEELSLAAEYDAALNIRDPSSQWDRERAHYANPLFGILNIGLRWAVSRTFYIEAMAKDVLENRYDERRNGILGWSRELKFVYVNHF